MLRVEAWRAGHKTRPVPVGPGASQNMLGKRVTLYLGLTWCGKPANKTVITVKYSGVPLLLTAMSADRFHELLLDVWREACRHIEIEASTRTIARILAH